VLDTNKHELLDSARAEALVEIGVHVTMNPVVLNIVNANMLALTAVADDNVLLFNNGKDGVGVPALVIIEVPDDINTPNVAMNWVVIDNVDNCTIVLTAADDDEVLLLNNSISGVGMMALVILETVDDVNTSEVVALVTEDKVLPFKADVTAHEEVSVSATVIIDAIPAIDEESDRLVLTALAAFDADKNELLACYCSRLLPRQTCKYLCPMQCTKMPFLPQLGDVLE